MATISGILIDGAGQPLPNAQIVLTALKTSSKVLNQSKALITTTSETGAYSVSAQVGHYAVTVFREGYPVEKVGYIRVFLDSTDGSLNDYLLNPSENEITPELLAQVMQARADALISATNASQSFTNAEKLLNDVVKKTGSTVTGKISFDRPVVSSVIASNTPKSASELNPNAIWGNNSSQYAVFNGNDNASLGKTNNLTIASWQGVGFAPLYASQESNAINSTVVIDTRKGTLNAIGGVYENSDKLAKLKDVLSNKGATSSGDLTIKKSIPRLHLTDSVSGSGAVLLSTGYEFGLYDSKDTESVKLSYNYATKNWSFLNSTVTIGGKNILVDGSSVKQLTQINQNNANVQYKKLCAIKSDTSSKVSKISLLVSGANSCVDTNNSLDVVNFGLNGSNVYLNHQIIFDSASSSNRAKYFWIYNNIAGLYELWIRFGTFRGAFGISVVSGTNSNTTLFLDDPVATESAPTGTANYSTTVKVLHDNDASLNTDLHMYGNRRIINFPYGKHQIISATNFAFNFNGSDGKQLSRLWWKQDSNNWIFENGSAIFNNEIISASTGNDFRFKVANKPSMIFRYDGDRYHILFTDATTPNGQWNNLRPLNIRSQDGVVDIGTGLTLKNVSVLKQGDAGLNTRNLPLITDFKTLSINSGIYRAFGSKVPNIATPNAPTGSSNARLTVTVRCDGSVTHYEVIENGSRNPKKWIGECYSLSGSLVIYWAEVVTSANVGTILPNIEYWYLTGTESAPATLNVNGTIIIDDTLYPSKSVTMEAQIRYTCKDGVTRWMPAIWLWDGTPHGVKLTRTSDNKVLIRGGTKQLMYVDGTAWGIPDSYCPKATVTSAQIRVAIYK
ncbi:hypothetical protein GCM10023211_02440 [Orbus sasakiae]|uniref:Lambda-like tail fibre protein N-terminal domain-containing protein n=1 Tax=Orbus sasakiae TaxID=1078475 RepID=A0ABP9MYI2_9GAMM